MYIVPNSDLYILESLRIQPTYNDTPYFSDRNAQFSYFNSKVKFRLSDLSYVRENENAIKVELPIQSIFDANYMMFKNTAYENQWFYAFILKCEYVSNEVTRIYYRVDQMQTWFMGDENIIDTAFVVRQHSVTDYIGDNRQEETPGMGDDLYYVELDETPEIQNLQPIAVSLFDHDASTQVRVRKINGVVQGLGYLIFDDLDLLYDWLDNMVSNGNSSDIVNMFMFPAALFSEAGGNFSPTITKNISRPSTMYCGYSPKNMKMMQYPYNFLYATNKEGNSATYRIEDFSGTPSFELSGNVTGTPSVGLTPKNYKNVAYNFDEMLTIQNYPQCSWIIDTYRAYCALNQNVMSNLENVQFPLMRSHAAANQATGAASGILGVLGNLASLNFGGAVSSAESGFNAAMYAKEDVEAQISATVAQYEDLALRPPQQGGNVSGGLLVANNQKTFTIFGCSARKEFCENIDDYFSMFGYAVNKLEAVNLNSRPHWNYVKLLNPVVLGDMPQDARAEIISILVNGIRFWKNGDEIGDFYLDNRASQRGWRNE